MLQVSNVFLQLFFIGVAVVHRMESFRIMQRVPPLTALRSNVLDKTAEETLRSEKIEWKPDGYQTWMWNGYKINYLVYGSSEKPPLLLIHGFGASVFHWRYNIPALSEKYQVFAFDMLGFGLSEKPIITYSAELWRDQALAFIESVIHDGRKDREPCLIAGNSLGGFTALYAASSEIATERNLVSGCILLNAAGRFRVQDSEKPKDEKPEWVKFLQSGIQRLVIAFSFVVTKQPARIEQVLKQVYPVDSTNVNSELVESIRYPAQDPNAAEVFYRVIAKNGNGPSTYVDDLLSVLKVPLYLVWGEKDPWIRPIYADMIQEKYPSAKRFSIDAGHCPHDEAPAAVNSAILSI